LMVRRGQVVVSAILTYGLPCWFDGRGVMVEARLRRP